MELKVWVEGVVRVVCGLSLTTSCQDVVIALAKSLGRTGRYLLIVKLRGAERQLVAEDCPLQHLSQLGQLAPEFHFVLRRTGPSRGDGARHTRQGATVVLARPPGPGASELRSVSPGPPQEDLDPVAQSFSRTPGFPRLEVFRQVLQQQRRLQELENQVRSLEKEAEVWEQEGSSARDAGPTVVREAELEDLERRLRQNEADLMLGLRWEEKFQAEVDREEDLQRGLQRLHALMEDHPHQLEELQAHSVQLEQEVQLEGHRLSSRADSRPPEEALRPLKQELRYRWQQGEDLEAAFSGTQRDLQAAEQKEMIEELNKELRQCKLQQFILQTGAPPPRDPRRPLPQQCWHHGAAEGLDVMKSSTAELK
uniref:Ras-associating domain-containing protein n=1 Tax=Gasterosteus aculeatus aculeatus TaxID=481459 RepID=A0AAQ4PPJ0_GASAC